MSGLKLTLDAEGGTRLLSSLSEAAKRFPEFGDALLRLIEASEEILLIHADVGVTAIADELVMGLYPSDRLAGLVAAFRAREPDAFAVEHGWLPYQSATSTTPEETTQ